MHVHASIVAQLVACTCRCSTSASKTHTIALPGQPTSQLAQNGQADDQDLSRLGRASLYVALLAAMTWHAELRHLACTCSSTSASSATAMRACALPW